MTSSFKDHKCNLPVVLCLWMMYDRETHRLYVSHIQHPTLSVICAFCHFPTEHDLWAPPSSYHSQAWKVTGYPAWPYRCADWTGMSPAGHTKRQKHRERKTEWESGRWVLKYIINTVQMDLQYSMDSSHVVLLLCRGWRTCWRCGMWWGFPQQLYKTHHNHHQPPDGRQQTFCIIWVYKLLPGQTTD